MKLTRIFLSFVLASLLASCASDKMATGGKSGAAPVGYLEIFTATKTVPDGDSTYDYPHTGYTIYDEHGRFVQYVPNHAGRMDAVPSRVSVPAGNYRIKATSERHGLVTFPIEIAAGQSRVIHLEGADLKGDRLQVRSIDGKAVGWSE